jgi:hypothetical protein
MIMYNQITDRYRIVQTEIVKALPIIGRGISAVPNYSLEVFRADIPVLSVPPRSASPASKSGQKPIKIKVRNGDVIYRISSIPHSVPIVGSFTTIDNYVRIYDMTLDLVVSDPVLFAQGYRLGKDPLNLAIEIFKSGFLYHATKTEHDKVRILRVPDPKFNDDLAKDTGMKIAQISQSSLRADPMRVQPAALRQDADKKKLEMDIKAEIQGHEDELSRIRDAGRRLYDHREQARQNDFEREEKARQLTFELLELERKKEFERKEKTRQLTFERAQEKLQNEHQFNLRHLEREAEVQEHMHQLHFRLRETAAVELTEIFKERIRDTFERGKSFDGVAEDSLKLLHAFNKSLLNGSTVNSTPPSGPSTSTNSTW